MLRLPLTPHALTSVQLCMKIHADRPVPASVHCEPMDSQARTAAQVARPALRWHQGLMTAHA